jgi:hypothetical protein
MATLGWVVEAQGTDPDDFAAFNRLGGRKTLRGAEGLAEKYLRRRIFGYIKRAGAYETIANRPGEPIVRIKQDWYGR